MAKELKTHLDLQDRNNANAEAIPQTWQGMLTRNDKGSDAANARHVARRHEMAQRPGQLKRMESPLLKGKKQVDTTADQLGKGLKSIKSQ